MNALVMKTIIENAMSSTKCKQNTFLYRIVMLFFGIISIFFGVWILNHPAISYIGLSYYLCMMLIILGAYQMVKAFDNQTNRQWSLNFLMGVIYIVIGFIMMSNVLWAEEILPYILGFTLMYEGLEYVSISTLKHESGKPVGGWIWYLIFGFLTIIFAFLIIFHPLFGFLNVIIWTGLAFISAGISALIAFIFNKKR